MLGPSPLGLLRFSLPDSRHDASSRARSIRSRALLRRIPPQKHAKALTRDSVPLFRAVVWPRPACAGAGRALLKSRARSAYNPTCAHLRHALEVGPPSGLQLGGRTDQMALGAYSQDPVGPESAARLTSIRRCTVNQELSQPRLWMLVRVWAAWWARGKRRADGVGRVSHTHAGGNGFFFFFFFLLGGYLKVTHPHGASFLALPCCCVMHV